MKKEIVHVNVESNIQELSNYVSQLTETIEKINNFKVEANVNFEHNSDVIKDVQTENPSIP